MFRIPSVALRSLAVFFAVAVSAFAQTPRPTPRPAASPGTSASVTPTPEPAQQPIWRCDLPGGSYEVAVRAIVSVSSHEYVIDGAARVTEVNVDTQGNMAVRFYFIDPNTPSAPDGLGQSALDKIGELTKQAAARTAQDDLWKRVVKSYPTTTHSHTIEYRLESADEVKKIFTSADAAFRSGRGATVKGQ